MRLQSAVVTLVGLALVVLGCGGDDEPEGPPTVVITDGGYEPSDLEIEVGQRVTFVNRGTVAHSAKDDRRGEIDVSPQPGETRHDGSEINRGSAKGFATHALFAEESQIVVFPVARAYKFYCAFHSDMRGTLTVVARP